MRESSTVPLRSTGGSRLLAGLRLSHPLKWALAGSAIADPGGPDAGSRSGQATGPRYVTNLALDLRDFNPQFSAVDSQWTAEVTTWNVARISRHLPPVHDREGHSLTK